MVGNIIAAALPEVPLSKGVISATTGILPLDSLPLLTMACCLPTLHIFNSTQKYGDLSVYGFGTIVAVAYHIAHMHPGGLEDAVLLGMSGSLWRTLDIIICQSLLARTVGHVLGARSCIVKALSNVAFPIILVSWSLLSKQIGAVVTPTLGTSSIVLLAIIIAAVVTKLVIEPKTLPDIPPRVFVLSALGFLCFPIPEIMPRLYWFFHSAWHTCMGVAFWELFYCLEVGHRKKLI